MALTLGDNFSYGGSKPLDARLTYSTLADMKAVADSTMYNGCLAYCVATDKTYQWKSTNTVDADTGRWREFTTGSSIEVDDEIDEESTNPVQNAVIAEALDAKQDALSAGDGINIDSTNEISVKEMASTDMPEIVTPLPSVRNRAVIYKSTRRAGFDNDIVSIASGLDGGVKPLSQEVTLPAGSYIVTYRIEFMFNFLKSYISSEDIVLMRRFVGVCDADTGETIQIIELETSGLQKTHTLSAILSISKERHLILGASQNTGSAQNVRITTTTFIKIA